MTQHEIIVGNVGTVYNGTDEDKAEKTYRDYVRISSSQQFSTRCYGETVTWMRNGEVYEETES